MRKMGGVLSLSPMVDVCRVPGFNRLEESYGEDAYLSAVLGTAFARGLQQGDLTKGVGTCSKHYLGYGGGGDADEPTGLLDEDEETGLLEEDGTDYLDDEEETGLLEEETGLLDEDAWISCNTWQELC